MLIRKQEKSMGFRMHHFSLLDASEQNEVSFLGEKTMQPAQRMQSNCSGQIAMHAIMVAIHP